MGRIQDFGATGAVVITVLVDNRADQLVKSTATVKHYMEKPLLAEHGFAGGRSQGGGDQAAWDAGTTCVALLENLRRMEIDPATITGIALSHGHHDHIAAMTDVLQAMRSGAVPQLGSRRHARRNGPLGRRQTRAAGGPPGSFPRALASGRGRHEVWPRARTAAEAVGSSGGQGGVV